MTAQAERIERVKDHLWRVGRRDAETGKTASDCALWAMARAYDRDNSTGRELIDRDTDFDLLDAFRDAYRAGRDT